MSETMTTTKARATLTIKSRPKVDGSITWSLWIRRPRPALDELITLEKFTSASDRAAVQQIAETYRKALRAGLSAPKAGSADDWYERFAKTRDGRISTVDADRAQWNKHIYRSSARRRSRR